MSVPTSELGPPTPLSRKRVWSLPRIERGGTHSPAGEGVGVPNSGDWRKSPALCLLCALTQRMSIIAIATPYRVQ